MDKELLRIILITTGLTVVIGTIWWGLFKKKKARQDINFYDEGDPLDNIDESLALKDDDFDVVPLGSALDDNLFPDPITATASESVYSNEKLNFTLVPKLIQFSLIASTKEGFNGKILADVFQQIGLEYGSNQIYERLDESRHIDFAVASMVEPGTFPEFDLDAFSCPGLVFFLQPRVLKNPLAVFNELLQIINLLAAELNGIKWDQNRKPLTERTIQELRESLGDTL